MSAVLEVRDLKRRYGARVALDGVSFEIGAGEIVGLLGANGAGKSTLLRTCAGMQPPDEGVVRISEVDVWQEPDKAKASLGYTPEEPALYEPLSAEEHLAFVAEVRGLHPDDARRETASLCERLGLAGRTREPVERFSHGMRKKLSFIAAVMHRPALLLCDEALEGFDVSAAIAAKDTLRARANEGTAILFSSHVTETIERLCDRVVLLHAGRVARTLARADWNAAPAAPSRLEQAFLDVARSGA
jgi:ABC-2 type transport system ATP-binding protein